MTRVVAPADADVLACIRDVLRAGGSVRQAVDEAGMRVPSFGAIWHLVLGTLPERLEGAAAAMGSSGVGAALRCLAVHTRTGGDPIPLIDAVEERIRERELTARELRSLTTQARMSARALLLLTPGMLALLAVMDPRGLVRSLVTPPSPVLFGTGVVLELLGAWWISRIVSPERAAGETPPERAVTSRLREVPVLRAFVAVTRGRVRAGDALGVADAADQLALVLDAGLGPVRAMEVVAASIDGAFGDAFRDACNAARRSGRRDAWIALGETSDDARSLIDALSQAQERGVPVAESLRRLASRLRRRHAAEVAERVRSASIKVLLPLSVVILPSFVLSCLVPLMVGGMRGLSQ